MLADYTLHDLGNGEYELETYSPQGENVIIFIDSKSSLYDQLNNMYESFDLNDYVYMWLEAKQNGVGGVPGVEELVEAGKWLESEYDRLAMAFSKDGM